MQFCAASFQGGLDCERHGQKSLRLRLNLIESSDWVAGIIRTAALPWHPFATYRRRKSAVIATTQLRGDGRMLADGGAEQANNMPLSVINTVDE